MDLNSNPRTRHFIPVQDSHNEVDCVNQDSLIGAINLDSDI